MRSVEQEVRGWGTARALIPLTSHSSPLTLVTMRLAIFMPAVLPVQGYGGTERIAVNQVRGLAARGHTISLLAGAGSTVPEAALVPVPLPAATGRFEIEPYLPAGTELLLSNVKLHHPPAACRGSRCCTAIGAPTNGDRHRRSTSAEITPSATVAAAGSITA